MEEPCVDYLETAAKELQIAREQGVLVVGSCSPASGVETR